MSANRVIQLVPRRLACTPHGTDGHVVTWVRQVETQAVEVIDDDARAAFPECTVLEHLNGEQHICLDGDTLIFQVCHERSSFSSVLGVYTEHSPRMRSKFNR